MRKHASKLRHEQGRPAESGPSMLGNVNASESAAPRALQDGSRWLLDMAESIRLAALLAQPPVLNTAANRAKTLATDVKIRC